VNLCPFFPFFLFLPCGKEMRVFLPRGRAFFPVDCRKKRRLLSPFPSSIRDRIDPFRSSFLLLPFLGPHFCWIHPGLGAISHFFFSGAINLLSFPHLFFFFSFPPPHTDYFLFPPLPTAHGMKPNPLVSFSLFAFGDPFFLFFLPFARGGRKSHLLFPQKGQ